MIIEYKNREVFEREFDKYDFDIHGFILSDNEKMNIGYILNFKTNELEDEKINKLLDLFEKIDETMIISIKKWNSLL